MRPSVISVLRSDVNKGGKKHGWPVVCFCQNIIIFSGLLLSANLMQSFWSYLTLDPITCSLSHQPCEMKLELALPLVKCIGLVPHNQSDTQVCCGSCGFQPDESGAKFICCTLFFVSFLQGLFVYLKWNKLEFFISCVSHATLCFYVFKNDLSSV